MKTIALWTIFGLLALTVLSGPAWTQELEKYQPIGAGVCEDVQLPCIKAVLKDTDLYFAVYREGKVIAITRLKPDGKEEVIWGDLKLPLKPNEKEI